MASFKGQGLLKNSSQQFMKTLPRYTEVKTLDFVVKISNSTVQRLIKTVIRSMKPL
jgi:hypothetical protein